MNGESIAIAVLGGSSSKPSLLLFSVIRLEADLTLGYHLQ